MCPATPTQASRFHLSLPSHGQAVQHGWWGSEGVARNKFSRWVGEYGTMPGGHIVLTYEENGAVIQVWPAQE
ncbi:hypothetical protein ABT272_30975 [Streptomyces sp900105245]|uniref:Uncharacterized protein n=1 Tax=Streptomyces sp. 900105245 TaxID=3154379 RepID=A0ABV1UEY1_9ACTN